MDHKSKPQILILGINWPPETFLQHLFNGLSDYGNDIYLACDKRPPLNWLVIKNHHWLWKPSWNTGFFKKTWNSLLLIFRFIFVRSRHKKQLLQLLRSQTGIKKKIFLFYQISPLLYQQTEIVYFPWVLGAEYYLDWFKFIHTPMVTSLRGAMVNVDPLVPVSGIKVAQTLQQIFQRVDAIHCVSQDILEAALQYGLDPNKAHVIRPAVNTILFTPLSSKPKNEKLIIVTTGSLIWRKGYEYALMAIRKLVDLGIDAEYHIIGEGPERQRVQYTIKDLELVGKVILYGKLQPAQVASKLQYADVFLLSSLSEGISNAALEAMACGLPVVTTNCGGMREAVTDGIEGFVVPVRDTKVMTERLARLALDPTLREHMGQAARERVVKDFQLIDQVFAFRELIVKIAKGNTW